MKKWPMSAAALRQLSLPSVPFSGARIARRLGAAQLASLQHDGFCVVDGCYESPWLAAAREEILLANKHGCMATNHTHVLVPGGDGAATRREVVAKQHVHELDSVVSGHLVDVLPCARELQRDLAVRSAIDQHLPHLGMRSGEQPLKLQFNAGYGGCFPMHTDADFTSAEQADNRVLTALLFLNPEHQPEHGGQLRLYPLLTEPVDIEPIDGRMVLFSSTLMLHRVLPSRPGPEHPRCVTTIWFHGDTSPDAGGVLARRKTAAKMPLSQNATAVDVAIFLLQPCYRSLTARLLYAQEWSDSIKESHPAGAKTDRLVAQHWKNVDRIAASFRPLLPTLDDGLEQLRDARHQAAAHSERHTAGETKGASFPPLPGVLEWLV